LLAIHLTLAAVAATPELALSQDEARAIAAAASNVSRHYDMRTSQKVMDWGMLGVTVAGVYGPRVAIMVNKRRAAEQRQPPAGNGAAMPAATGETAWAADPFAGTA